MAAVADVRPFGVQRDEGFFLGGAILMALVLVAGFSVQLAMGRSTFAAPPLVHAHAIVFMGWVAIYVSQNVFVATNAMACHRRLGWLATAWMAAMLALGFLVTLAMVRRGHAPFFFRPQQFLIFNPATLLAFIGLTTAAIVLRRRTDWHRRLHFCGMTMLLGPGFGRLLPMPLLIPWAWEATFVAGLLFPIAGVIRDIRRNGHVHPAWGWGLAVMIGVFGLVEAVTYSPVGGALYSAATAGTPGAELAGLQFPPPPGAPLVTGR